MSYTFDFAMILWLIIFSNFIIFPPICQSSCNSMEYLHCGGIDRNNCVPKEWWCDGHPDCDSGADESNCPNKKCLQHEFMCHSGTQCIPKLLHCDRKFHCIDKSDEVSCPNLTKKFCNPLTQFDCNQDGEICINFKKICDGKNDCGRNQDELPGGTKDNCQRNDCQLIPNGGCSHLCINFYTHIKCDCPPGYKLLSNNKTCVDIDECGIVPSKCSQICKNYLGGYNCSCYNGYKIDPTNPSRCIDENGDRSILITLFGGRLFTIDLNVGSNQSFTLNSQITWPNIDIDLYHKPPILFWNTKLAENIKKRELRFNSMSDIKNRFAIGAPILGEKSDVVCTGLSFDWLTGLLFWTSALENRIYVTNTTSNVTTVFLDKGLDNPRSIVVDPFHTKIYWIDWGSKFTSPKIRVMLMNRENHQFLVTSGLRQPLDLKLDYYDNRLYWCDINPGLISYIDLKKQSIPVVVVINKLLHPFSVAVFESKIYWSDWRQNQIISADKNNGDIFTVLAKIHKPFSVRPLSQLSQPNINESQAEWYSCLRNRINPCHHICLPFPPETNKKNKTKLFKCLSPKNSIENFQNQEFKNISDLEKFNRYQIIMGVFISLIVILCLSISIIFIYICRHRKWINSNKDKNRKIFKHSIISGDLMFIFKCSSHSSQLSELLVSDFNNTSNA